MTEQIAPEEFPFTVEELTQAADRWLGPEESGAFVEHFLNCARESRELHEERSARMRKGGQAPIPYSFDVDFPDVVLAYLTLVSPSAAERVEVLMRKRWVRVREQEIEEERQRAAERAGLIPTMDDILDDAERRGEFSWDDPRVYFGMAATGNPFPEPPPATPEVIAVAEAYVAEDIAEWEKLLAAVRSGGPLPQPRLNVIRDGDETLSEEELPDREPNWAFIDDYINRSDRWRRGESRLFDSIARGLPRFNGEMVRALRVAPTRAVPRIVTHHLLGSGYINPFELDSPVGLALATALGSDGPPRTKQGTAEVYLSADLLEWYESNRNRFEAYPLFDDWRGRKRTRRDIAWMRMKRDRADELEQMWRIMYHDTSNDANSTADS